ncbi:MAG: bacillithiol biosynthesis deacetylase BshB1 [Coriobacteriia bacterium]|nr:bacillithiol biosynthesis deacetylase BshB1 [Coriobacteriia bacterium]
MTTESLCDVLCIGAHPDDVEIGMGATVAKMVGQGMRVGLVDLTNGEPTPHGTPERRAAEASEAARVLGATRRTLTQSNRYLFDTVEARMELAEVIRELRPQTLFVPFPQDAHPDHLAASQIALAARFYAKLTKTKMSGEPYFPERVYRYMAVHMRLVAEPSFIVDVSEHLSDKIAALGAYESQFAENPANNGMLEFVEQQAAAWGAMARVRYGEPFFALEPICLRSITDLV